MVLPSGPAVLPRWKEDWKFFFIRLYITSLLNIQLDEKRIESTECYFTLNIHIVWLLDEKRIESFHFTSNPLKTFLKLDEKRIESKISELC